MSAMDYKEMLRKEREAASKKQATDSNAEHELNDAIKTHCTSTKSVSADDIHFQNITPWSLKNCELERVGEIQSVFYGKEILNENVENQLLEYTQIMGTIPRAWRQLKARRLQCWGSFPKTNDLSGGDLSAAMPSWLESLIDAIIEQGIFNSNMRPNNVLINQYNADEGIFHHTDGPAYHDRVAIISLGSDTILSFRKKLSSDQIGIDFAGDVCSVVLKRRSILVFEGDAYNHYMHGIECDQPVQKVGEQGPCVNAHLLDLDPSTDIHSVHRTVRTSITFRRLKSL